MMSSETFKVCVHHLTKEQKKSSGNSNNIEIIPDAKIEMFILEIISTDDSFLFGGRTLMYMQIGITVWKIHDWILCLDFDGDGFSNGSSSDHLYC